MAKICLNNVELEFDVFEAENAEKFQKETQKIIAAAEKAKGENDIGTAIREQCRAVFAFIDALFGKGVHKKIFGDSVNLRTCLEAYNTIISAITEEKDNFLNSVATPKNRTQRRAAGKK